MFIARLFPLATGGCRQSRHLQSRLVCLIMSGYPVEPIRQFFSGFSALRGTMLVACALFFLFLGYGSGATPAVQTASADGRMAYVQNCAACHANGVAGAPRIGMREEWSGRLAQGHIELARSVLKGKNGMPPKGGNASLSDEAALAALAYIVSAVK